MTNSSTSNALLRHMELRAQAEVLLGGRAWRLLSHYGKLMDGPDAGQYVSGLPADQQLQLAQRLHSGQTLDIHLMHRHRPGDHEPSLLRFVQGSLVMVFSDHQEIA